MYICVARLACIARYDLEVLYALTFSNVGKLDGDHFNGEYYHVSPVNNDQLHFVHTSEWC